MARSRLFTGTRNLMLASLFRHSLARELAVIIAVKIVLIILAAMLLFGPQQRPHVDAAALFQHLFSRDRPQQ